jgi:hypothetical protein
MNSRSVDSMRVRRRRIGALVALLFAGTLLFFFDPATSDFYPPCLFKTFLGTQCPGCGSLRAAHQLLHGNLSKAWALNKPVLVALPLAAAIGLLNLLRNPKTP